MIEQRLPPLIPNGEIWGGGASAQGEDKEADEIAAGADIVVANAQIAALTEKMA